MKQLEVALAYTNHTWDSRMITIPKNVHPGNAEEYAEGKALSDAAKDGMSVAFVSVIWEPPDEEEDDFNEETE